MPLVSPKQEIEIPEVNFHSLFELISMQEAIRTAQAPNTANNMFGITVELSSPEAEAEKPLTNGTDTEPATDSCKEDNKEPRDGKSSFYHDLINLCLINL